MLAQMILPIGFTGPQNQPNLHRIEFDETTVFYADLDGFQRAMNERHDATKRWEFHAREISFEAIDDYRKRHGLDEAQSAYRLNTDIDLLRDTEDHTGLIVKTTRGEFLLGEGAGISISNRIDINGKGLYELDPAVRALVYNERFAQLAKDDTKVIVIYAYGKVRAIMSSQYAVIESNELVNQTVDQLRQRFGEVSFAEGFISHDLYELKVGLPDAAAQLHQLYDDMATGLTPGVRILTSDTGYAANQINPYWSLRSTKKPTSWIASDAIYVVHKGHNTLTRVLAQLPNLFVRFQDTVKKLSSLMEVDINVDVAKVIRRACRDLKLGKKLRAKLVEQWQINTPLVRVTAYDVCMHIMSAAALMEDGRKKTALEEKVGKAINLRWNKVAILADADDDDDDEE